MSYADLWELPPHSLATLTLESQLLYRMGLLRALSRSMLGKCLRATMSMFSSVQRLSSSSTNLSGESVQSLCNYKSNQPHIHCGVKTSLTKIKMRLCIILSPSFGTKQMIYRLRNASNSPILEESQRFMSPDADETLDRQCLQRPQRLEDASDPARHLSRRVDVVRLRVLREPLLFQRERLVERTSKQTFIWAG